MSSSLFEDKRFDVDDREVLFEITLPPGLGRLGFIGCDLHFWVLSLISILSGMLLNCIVAVLVYHFLLPHQGRIRGYLIGYSLIVPAILALPFVALFWIPMTNLAFLLSFVAGLAGMVLFRCLEAIHGTMPAVAKSSMGSFLFYFASTLQFNLDPKTGMAVPITRPEIIQKANKFAINFVQTSLLYSILLPFQFKPFQTGPPASSIPDLFSLANIVNNFLMACLTSLVLDCKFSALSIMLVLLSDLWLSSIHWLLT